jgi:hypothetical protein
MGPYCGHKGGTVSFLSCIKQVQSVKGVPSCLNTRDKGNCKMDACERCNLVSSFWGHRYFYTYYIDNSVAKSSPTTLKDVAVGGKSACKWILMEGEVSQVVPGITYLYRHIYTIIWCFNSMSPSTPTILQEGESEVATRFLKKERLCAKMIWYNIVWCIYITY